MKDPFKNVDKEKNRKNALIGLLAVLILLTFYIQNRELKLPPQGRDSKYKNRD